MFHSIYNNNNHPFDDNHLLSNFPSHLLDDELFMGTSLPYHHHPPPPPPPPLQPPLVSATIQEITNNGQISDEMMNKIPRKGVVKKKQDRGGSSRRKAGKKDRHSKIYTAQGPRDRRMRLSLQIARKFFDLQDMLGFDKASKTIEWLFNKSRAAIKDLADKSCTSATTSPFEEVDCNNDYDDGGNKKKEKLWCERRNVKGGKYRMNDEKRKEARARARERTKEKLMKNKEVLELDENPNNYNDNCSNHMVGNDSVIRVDRVGQLEDQMASVGIIEKFLAASSSMGDFRQDCLDGPFSMEFPGSRVSESSRINGGLLQELVVNCEYNHQVQGPNFAFMDSRVFNY